MAPIVRENGDRVQMKRRSRVKTLRRLNQIAAIVAQQGIGRIQRLVVHGIGVEETDNPASMHCNPAILVGFGSANSTEPTLYDLIGWEGRYGTLVYGIEETATCHNGELRQVRDLLCCGSPQLDLQRATYAAAMLAEATGALLTLTHDT